jgi:NAD(P)-dependent dehydrogenase (short-subunit alcohol dehydrogenase family)
MPPQPQPIAGLAPPRRIVILGAAGPLGVATAIQADAGLTLRLADRRSLAEAALAPPQTPGAPLPDPALLARHQEVRLDVTDPASVRRALDGMDTVINCTVNRPDPVQAFRVNTLGAWHVMQAAVALGIRRVVHTGPALGLAPYPIGVQEDRDIRAGVDRPGTHLYFMSKYLGQEIVRVFAEEAGIATPALYFVDFTSTDPAVARRRAHPCIVSWDDAGRAVMAAARIAAMPRPFVAVNVLAPAPHGRYADEDAQALLDWAPRDRIDDVWYRPAP